MSKSKDMVFGDQKDKIVAELYALRAGLSAISERADDIRNLEDDIEDERNQSKLLQDKIDENNKKLSQSRNVVSNMENKIVDLNSEFSQKVERIVRNKIDKFNNSISPKAYILQPRFGIYIGIGIIVLTVILANAFDDWIDPIPVFVIGAAITAFTIILCFIRAKKCKEYRLQAIHEINRDTEQLKYEIESTKEEISALKRIGNELHAQKEAQERQIEARVSEIESDIMSIAQKASLYNNALETEYSDLLNPADWKNTDLCIFYLQTGRADSIKECLQLADRQRQNDEIVGTIAAASDRICGEIRSGFKALGSTMVTCINALSMQIETVGNSMMVQNEATIRALGAIEKSNSELLSAGLLNNALQAKANETSEALLRDYECVQKRAGILF